MNIKERFELIKRNTAEILTEDELRGLLKKKKKPVIYLGTAITGTPHIGYFFPVLKMADFLRAGMKVKFLLADLHGALDNCPWNILEKRYKYYQEIIPLMFKAIGANTKNFEFVKGSEVQLDKKYFLDVLKMSTKTLIKEATKAASEVVKLGDNPKLGGIIYPIMQSLDEEYLGVDAQFGGLDQRKILVFARENLPKVGYKSRVEIMVPMIPGLIGKKMSASDEKSKVDLLDSEADVNKKLRSAEFVSGDSDNGVMAFLKYVIMTLKGDKKEKFVVFRDKKFGGDLVYSNYSDVEADVRSKKVHPLDLKNAVALEINNLLKDFRKKEKELKKFQKQAYS